MTACRDAEAVWLLQKQSKFDLKRSILIFTLAHHSHQSMIFSL